MDMMALALAKKYTDEKVGSGSGSGGGLPVATLETVVTAEPTVLSAEDCVKMDELVAMGMPCVLNFNFDDGSGGYGRYSVVCATTDKDDGYGGKDYGVVAAIGVGTIMAMRMDGVWTITIMA